MDNPKKPGEQHGNGKGKEKELAAAERSDRTENSMLDRIGQSASGLLQSSYRLDSPTSTSADLANLRSSTSKGGSSSAASIRPKIHLEEGLRRNNVLAQPTHGPDAGDSFRSSASTDANEAQATFDQFIHDAPLEDQPLAMDGTPSVQNKPHLVIPGGTEGMVETDLRRSSQRENSDRATAICETDGAEVVALLSNRQSVLEDEISDELPVSQEDTGTVNDIDGKKGQGNPFVLIPDFSGDLRTFHDALSASSSGDRLQPWYDILNKYHDEVWGDALPIVHEARKEVEVVKQNGVTDASSIEDRPAIRRLRMLLGQFEHGD